MRLTWSPLGLPLRLFLCVAAILLVAGDAWAANPSAARSRAMQADMMVDRASADDVEAKLKEAEGFLEGATPAERAPIDAQIKEIRDKLAAANDAVYNRAIRQARGSLAQAKQFREYGNSEPEVANKLQEAEKLLKDVPDAKKAAVLAEIKAVRDAKPAASAEAPGSRPAPAAPAQASGGAPAPGGAPAAAAGTGNPSAARSRVSLAKMSLESGRTGEVETRLQEAEKFLEGATDAERAPLVAQIKEIRAKLASVSRPATAPSQASGATPPASGGTPAAASSANPSMARNRVTQAEMSLGRTSPQEIEGRLKEAEKFLEGATDAEKAPIVAKINEIRAKLATQINEANAKTVATAMSLLTKAKSFQNEGRDDRVEPTLKEAETLLKDVPEAQKTPVLADIKAFRDKLPPPQSAEAKAMEERIARDINQAEGEIVAHPNIAVDSLKQAARRLASDEAKQALDAATVQKLQGRLAQVQAKFDDSKKKYGLNGAAGPLKELEEQLVADPFKGLDQVQANKVHTDLAYLAKRVHGAIDDLPKDDAEVKAVNARLAAAEQKLAAAGTLWGKTEDIARLTGSWEFYKRDIAGWEQETTGQASFGFRPWLMIKTASAIKYRNYWLAQKETKELLDQYKEDPVVKATLDEVEKTRDAAAAKLNEAFNRTLDEAEKMPLPEQPHPLTIPAAMSREAEQWFAGTKYKDDNVARAVKLDQKWQAEIAAIAKQYADALSKMLDEAAAAWPAINASIKAQDGFKPADVASFKGRTIRLKAVRNRSGFDFDGQYALALWIDDVPLAGNFEPHVYAAVQEAWRRTRQGVNLYVDWEVIAVVDGPGKIKRRVITELIDQRTRAVLGKLESYEPMDCILIRVVAMRAGPVAVGLK
jgi:hypothetical protein